jgi:ubiquitin-protein ligase
MYTCIHIITQHFSNEQQVSLVLISLLHLFAHAYCDFFRDRKSDATKTI